MVLLTEMDDVVRVMKDALPNNDFAHDSRHVEHDLKNVVLLLDYMEMMDDVVHEHSMLFVMVYAQELENCFDLKAAHAHLMSLPTNECAILLPELKLCVHLSYVLVFPFQALQCQLCHDV